MYCDHSESYLFSIVYAVDFISPYSVINTYSYCSVVYHSYSYLPSVCVFNGPNWRHITRQRLPTTGLNYKCGNENNVHKLCLFFEPVQRRRINTDTGSIVARRCIELLVVEVAVQDQLIDIHYRSLRASCTKAG